MTSSLQRPPSDDALFHSEVGALKFALNYQHGGMKRPSMTVMMGGGAGKKGRGLGGLDGAAQAGMISLELGNLSDLHRALLVGRYATPSRPCDCRTVCCRGWRENEEWKIPIDWLTQYVLENGLTGTISHYRFRRSLITRHFGVKESFIQMSAACGVERHTASRQYKVIHEHLTKEEKRAKIAIKGILEAVGVVGDDSL